jgi:hypothetical protein
VKASSIDRRLAKTALEARLGTFVAADYEQAVADGAGRKIEPAPKRKFTTGRRPLADRMGACMARTDMARTGRK